MGYYAANAREGGGNCGPGQMADIGDARVISETGDAVVVAVDYSLQRQVARRHQCLQRHAPSASSPWPRVPRATRSPA